MVINQKSFRKTPQASDDLFSFTENALLESDSYDAASQTLTLDLTSGDHGGNAKRLFSISSEDGTDDSALWNDLSQSTATDDWITTESGNAIKIVDGKISYRFTATSLSEINSLAEGETFTDTFSYAIRLGNGTLSWATATFTISGSNDAPVAMDDSYSVQEGAQLVGSVATNDHDPDNGETAALKFSLIDPAPEGFTFNEDGSFTLDASHSAYQGLNENEFRDIELAYLVTDIHGATSSATLKITVQGISTEDTGNNVPIAIASSISVLEDSTYSGRVSATDADEGETQSLTYTLIGDAPEGLTFFNDGSYQFDASAYDHLGEGAQITLKAAFAATDIHGASSTPGELSITVTGTNDAPTVAAAIAALTDEDQAPFVVDLLQHASDVDASDSLSVANLQLVDGDASGITATASGLSVDPSAYNHLAAGEQAVVSYTYDVVDGHGGSAPQSATITISGRNDAPAWVSGTTFATLNAYPYQAYDGQSQFTLDFADHINYQWEDSGEQADAVLVDANGKILVGGVALGMARYNPDGSLDETFGNGGIVPTNALGQDPNYYAHIKEFSPLNDGKFLAYGSMDNNPASGIDSATFIARYHENGSLDTSFGLNGIVTYNASSISDETSAGFAIDSSGNIYSFTSTITSAEPRITGFFINKWSPEGVPDTHFGQEGVLFLPQNSTYINAHAIAIWNDKLYISGSLQSLGSSEETVLYRLNLDGTPDTTFGLDGSAGTSHFDALSQFPIRTTDILFDSQGRVILVGHGGGTTALTRYDENGQLDPTFGENGTLSIKLISTGNAINDGYGRILFSGALTDSQTNTVDFAVMRLTEDGVLDTTFGNGLGYSVVDFNGNNDFAATLTVDSAGNIILVGSTDVPDTQVVNSSDFAIAMLDPNGVLLGEVPESLGATGTLVFDDADLSDLHVVVVSADPGNPLGGTMSATVVDAATGEGTGSVQWRYSVAHTLAKYLAEGETAEEHFTVTLSDGQGGTTVEVVTVTVHGSNDAPVVTGASHSLTEQESVSGWVTATDPDINQNPAIVFALVNAAPAGLTFNPDGSYSFDASSYSHLANGEQLQLNIAFTATDGLSKSQPGWLSITVTGGNSAPFVVAEQTTASGSVTAGTAVAETVFNPAITDIGSLYDYASDLTLDGSGRVLLAGYTLNPATNSLDFAVVRYNKSGTLDTDFADNGILRADTWTTPDQGYAIAHDASGNILLYGSVNSYPAVASYLPDGTLNTAFSGDGWAFTTFGGSNYSPADLVVDAAGGILLSGTALNPATGTRDFALTRLHPDGAVDTAFGTNGVVFKDLGYNDILGNTLVDGAGNILLIGNLWDGTANTLYGITRFNAQGQLDTGFGTSGQTVAGFPGGVEGEVNAATLDATGHILVAGVTWGGSSGDLFLARYTPDGTLDTTFGTNGFADMGVNSHSDSANEYATHIATDGAGRILIAGYAQNIANDGSYDLLLMRLNADGTRDTSFGDNGIVWTDLASGQTSSDTSAGLAIDDEGRIFLGAKKTDIATGDRDFALVVFNDDGTPYTGSAQLTSSGTVTFDDIDLSDTHTLSVTPADGNLLGGKLVAQILTEATGVMAGEVAWTYTLDDAVASTVPSGSSAQEVFHITLDDGQGGTVTQTVTLTVYGPNAAPVAEDAAFVVAEDTSLSARVNATDIDLGTTETLAYRLLDPAPAGLIFETDGSFHFDASHYGHLAQGQTLNLTLPFVASDAHTDSAPANLTISVVGQNDAPEYLGGALTGAVKAQPAGGANYLNDLIWTERLGSDVVNAMQFDAEGRILVGSTYGVGVFQVMRYHADGSLDTSYGNGGVATVSVPGATYAWGMGIDASGKTVMIGSARNPTIGFDMAVVRFNADGSIDTGFGGGDGIVITNSPYGYTDTPYSVGFDSADRLLVGGLISTASSGTPSNFGLVRYLPDGRIDTSFGTNGFAIVDITGAARADQIQEIIVNADDSILVGGIANNGTNNDFVLARFTSAGRLDSTFGTGGKTVVNILGNDVLKHIAYDAQGNILAIGHSTDGSANDHITVARFTASGVLDTSFNSVGYTTIDLTSAAFTRENVTSFKLDSSGRILIVGTYTANTSSSDATDMLLVRLNPDGTLDTTFGGGDGFVTLDAGYSKLNTGEAIEIDGAGNIIVSGYGWNTATSNYDAVLMIFDTNGVPYTPSVEQTLITEGTVSFTDIDLQDGHTVTVTPDAGNTLNGTLTASITQPSTGGFIGEVKWEYAVDNTTATAIGEGYVNEHFILTLDDGQGGTFSQDITVTVYGLNAILGTAADDNLFGTSGNDILVGGLGSDTLTGNGGNDVFKWSAEDVNPNDPLVIDDVLDFGANDVIDLSGLLTTKNLSHLSVTQSNGDTHIHLSDGTSEIQRMVLHGYVAETPEAILASLQTTDLYKGI